MAFPFAPKRQLFPPPQFNMPQAAPEQQQQEQPDDYASKLRQIYESANGPMTQAYGKHLEEYPNKPQPDMASRLGAIFSGAGAGWRDPEKGGLVAQHLLEQPRVKALNEWKTKGEALATGANLEDKNLKDRISLLRESDTANRNVKKDQSEDLLRKKQIENYDSLIKDRNTGKISFHEDKTTGHLFSINATTGEKKDLGVVDLSPEQKADLQVKTQGREESNRVSGRKDLFNFTNSKIADREKDVHRSNRTFDAANPVRAALSGFESIDQQNKAIAAAAKELNIEEKGKYGQFFNSDGSMKSPQDLEHWYSSSSTAEQDALLEFYNNAKARAQEKLNTRRGTESTATSYPKVNLPKKDPRIQ
jgi:hypothetical protein